MPSQVITRHHTQTQRLRNPHVSRERPPRKRRKFQVWGTKLLEFWVLAPPTTLSHSDTLRHSQRCTQTDSARANSPVRNGGTEVNQEAQRHSLSRKRHITLSACQSSRRSSASGKRGFSSRLSYRPIPLCRFHYCWALCQKRPVSARTHGPRLQQPLFCECPARNHL